MHCSLFKQVEKFLQALEKEKKTFIEKNPFSKGHKFFEGSYFMKIYFCSIDKGEQMCADIDLKSIKMLPNLFGHV